MATSALAVGRQIRHHRTAAGLTLDALGEQVGSAASQLSLIENGKREPRLGLLQAIADALGVELAALLTPEPPSRRDALEIALADAQCGQLYRELGLPEVRSSKKIPMEALEALVG